MYEKPVFPFTEENNTAIGFTHYRGFVVEPQAHFGIASQAPAPGSNWLVQCKYDAAKKCDSCRYVLKKIGNLIVNGRGCARKTHRAVLSCKQPGSTPDCLF